MHIFNAEGSARYGPVPFMKKNAASPQLQVGAAFFLFCYVVTNRTRLRRKHPLS